MCKLYGVLENSIGKLKQRKRADQGRGAVNFPHGSVTEGAAFENSFKVIERIPERCGGRLVKEQKRGRRGWSGGDVIDHTENEIQQHKGASQRSR